MKIIETPLAGLRIIEPTLYVDTRGYFYESFQQIKYDELGLPAFVQDNISYSKKNVLRGLHYQLPQAQGKLVGVIQGTVWDVAVDIRTHSPTFKKWFSIILNDETHQQLYIPPGFAHGFCVLSESAIFNYKCTDFYASQCDRGIIWNDENFNIHWPIKNPILSEKDSGLPSLSELTNEHLFT